MPENENLKVGGFVFDNEIIAEKAKKEQNAVSYLRNQIVKMNSQQRLEAYKGLIDKGVFDTAVGYSFLKSLQSGLIADRSIDIADIPPIPVASDIITEGNETQALKLKWQRRFHILLPFTIMLIGCLIFMIVITATSNNLTILDYKDKLENQYASWEEDLSAREEEVKAREEQLLEEEQNIDNGENANGS